MIMIGVIEGDTGSLDCDSCVLSCCCLNCLHAQVHLNPCRFEVQPPQNCDKFYIP